MQAPFWLYLCKHHSGPTICWLYSRVVAKPYSCSFHGPKSSNSFCSHGHLPDIHEETYRHAAKLAISWPVRWLRHLKQLLCTGRNTGCIVSWVCQQSTTSQKLLMAVHIKKKASVLLAGIQLQALCWIGYWKCPASIIKKWLLLRKSLKTWTVVVICNCRCHPPLSAFAKCPISVVMAFPVLIKKSTDSEKY